MALGRPYRLAVRTPPFHGGGTGSIPVRVANFWDWNFERASNLYRGRLLRRLCRQASTARKTKTTNPRIKSTTAPGLFSHSCPRLLTSSLKSMPAVIYTSSVKSEDCLLGIARAAAEYRCTPKRQSSLGRKDYTRGVGGLLGMPLGPCIHSLMMDLRIFRVEFRDQLLGFRPVE